MIFKFCVFFIYIIQITNAFFASNVNISRIVVIADIHNDLDRFKTILQNAKIIDKNDVWISKPNTLVVQLGDQIDRKSIDNDDITDNHNYRLIRYTERLRDIAYEKDSYFISMIGNHELNKMDKIRNKKDLNEIISRRPIVFTIGRYIFCHGGFQMEHHKILKLYDKSIKDLNEIWYKYVNLMMLTDDEKYILNSLILDQQNSILYTRKIADKTENIHLFNELDIDYMFVGHTTTKHIFVRNNVWYLDQLLREAFDDKIYTYIEIEDEKIKIKGISYD
jgi:hypothetical protein